MLPPGSKLYRDEIHGDIILDDLAVAMMDTPEFQRLARIKQLGFAHLVYRSAQHTRLQHSVGVYHMARLLVDQVAENHARLGLSPPFGELPSWFEAADGQRRQNLKRLIGACALLHDITHVPFGHTLEDEYQRLYEKHDSLRSPRLHRFLYSPESELRALLTRDEPWIGTMPNDVLRNLIYLILSFEERVKADDDSADGYRSFERVLSDEIMQVSDERRSAEEKLNRLELENQPTPRHRKRIQELVDIGGRLENLRDLYSALGPTSNESPVFFPYMSDFIANTICADLLDYVLRDTFHTGFPCDFNDRLLQFFLIEEDRATGGMHLVIGAYQRHKKALKRDVITMIFDLLRTRYKLSQQVYYHRVKAAASAMLVRALEDCENDGCEIEEGHPYEGPTDAIIRMSDEEVVAFLLRESAPEAARSMASAIANRRLYKTVLTVPRLVAIKSPGGVSRFVAELRTDRDRRLDIEETLAGTIGAEPQDVIVYCPGPKMQAKSVQVRVQLGEHRIGPLTRFPDDPLIDRELEVLNESYRAQWRVFVFLHPRWFDREETSEQEYIRALVAERFLREFEIEHEQDVEFGWSYAHPIQQRLQTFWEWIEPQERVLASDAEKIRRSITEPESWRRIVSDAGNFGVQPFELPKLFEARKRTLYVESYLAAQHEVGPDHPDFEEAMARLLPRIGPAVELAAFRETHILERDDYLKWFEAVLKGA